MINWISSFMNDWSVQLAHKDVSNFIYLLCFCIFCYVKASMSLMLFSFERIFSDRNLENLETMITFVLNICHWKVHFCLKLPLNSMGSDEIWKCCLVEMVLSTLTFVWPVSMIDYISEHLKNLATFNFQACSLYMFIVI